MSFAAGRFGSPGMVIIEPRIATTNPAPAFNLNSRTGRSKPDGARRFLHHAKTSIVF